MENKKPLLSICIPTYNRAMYLDKSIASIVSQDSFTNGEVELVISDNASDDNTEEIVEKYQVQYKNIFYFKNKENIKDKNFPAVIDKSHGVFRKLCNDTLIFQSGSIQYILNIIKQNIEKRPVIFFMNCVNRARKRKKYIVFDFNSFVKTVSFWSTWIGGFGIWEDDFIDIKNKEEGCDLSLWQTKVLFEILEKKGKSFVDNTFLFEPQKVANKDLTYGIYQVFYINYLGLYQKYLETGLLRKKSYNYIKRHLLFDFFLSWIINYRFYLHEYKVNNKDNYGNMERVILTNYNSERYRIYFYFKLYVIILGMKIKKKMSIIFKKNEQ